MKAHKIFSILFFLLVSTSSYGQCNSKASTVNQKSCCSCSCKKTKSTYHLKTIRGNYTNQGFGTVRIVEIKGVFQAIFPTYTYNLEHQFDNTYIMEPTTNESQYFNPDFEITFLEDDNGFFDEFQINIQTKPVIFKRNKEDKYQQKKKSL